MDIRSKFIEFFKSKGHLTVPPSLLAPENDPSVLFTTAGMQQFKGYYLNPENAPSTRVTTIQPCLRTSDIEEVGDDSHLTLFEMMGNFSFGYTEDERGSTQIEIRTDTENSPLPEGRDRGVGESYFKKEAIEWAWEFLTDQQWSGLDKEKITATYFGGEGVILEDTESRQILSGLIGLKEIKASGLADNFWGPTGLEGPCGPTVEFYYNGLEIWNLVFNEFHFKDDNYSPLQYQGVDTGMGLERLQVALSGLKNAYETDVLKPLLKKVQSCGIESEKNMRIIADHIKAATFAIADGIFPSNKEAGYVVRRLIRRSMVLAGSSSNKLLPELFTMVVEFLRADYPHLNNANAQILQGEIDKWEPIKIKGERELEKLVGRGGKITGKEAFNLYQSHGFPIELTTEIANKKGIDVNQEEFWQELEHHKDISRAGLEKKFKGGLAGHSDIEIRYHTAAHLLLASLRGLIGEKVFQRGANITPERLRFDFSCDHGLTQEEIAHIEEMVNEKISQNLPVSCEEMTQAEAEKKGAVGTFKDRYSDVVKIYTIGDAAKPCSIEFCGGPHVKNTYEIGEFKITKEESAGAGVRRIRAHLE